MQFTKIIKETKKKVSIPLLLNYSHSLRLYLFIFFLLLHHCIEWFLFYIKDCVKLQDEFAI